VCGNDWSTKFDYVSDIIKFYHQQKIICFLGDEAIRQIYDYAKRRIYLGCGD
jgi:hypothetical protein